MLHVMEGKYYEFSRRGGRREKTSKQAGAELCQAQLIRGYS